MLFLTKNNFLDDDDEQEDFLDVLYDHDTCYCCRHFHLIFYMFDGRWCASMSNQKCPFLHCEEHDKELIKEREDLKRQILMEEDIKVGDILL